MSAIAKTDQDRGTRFFILNRNGLEQDTQKLDGSGDGALEACVAGFVHFAHTSSSDREQGFVRAEFIACCQGHLVESVQFIRSGGGQVLGHGLPGRLESRSAVA